MVHSGYEASAVDATFGSLSGFLSAVRATVFGGTYADPQAMRDLETQPAPQPLVQLNVKASRETVEV
jgi:hypothetical protein